MKEQMKKEANL